MIGRMYGKRGLEKHRDGGDDVILKATLKHQEDREWRKDTEDEMYEDTRHSDGICRDPKSGMYGCEQCYPDYDHYDNSELDNVPGVWCNTDWRDPWT